MAQVLVGSWHSQALSYGNCTCCPHSLAPPRGQHPALGQLEWHIRVVLAVGVWVVTGSAGDMGGDGLCSAHISPSDPLLLKQEPRWEVLGKWEA